MKLLLLRCWMPLAALAFAISTGAGCAHNYVYWPAGPGLGEGPAGRYPIPPESPRGEVYVTSFGFTDVDVTSGQTVDLLHARLAVVNHGPGMWTLDGREQALSVPGQPTIGAAFLNTDAGSGPVYTIGPGQTRVFDLYYSVPPPQDQAKNLAGFELLWRVNVDGRPMAQRTPFQRLTEPAQSYGPYPAFVSLRLGWAPLWWYGPIYPYRYPPVIRTYYYPPIRGRTGPGWRTGPAPSGNWRGGPPAGGGGWRGSPGGGGGGWRGSPGGGRGGGGGWRGGPR
jgi:hypothetical protein